MEIEYEKILKRSESKHKEILRNMRHLSKLNKNNFDRTVHGYHEDVFSIIDCQKCGNCCRNLGPRFREMDIKHICKSSGLSPKLFFEKYLEQDPDGVGYILKELPCPFQNDDNTCSDYEHRTLSCKEFPHTLSTNIQRKLVGLALDSLFCPAAFLIAERIIESHRTL
jgi:uncharacterized protein